jgi:hypothetical protein
MGRDESTTPAPSRSGIPPILPSSPPRFPFWVSPLPHLTKNHPFLFMHLRIATSQSLCFDIHTKCRGCTPLGVPTAYPLPLIPVLVPRKTEGSPFFSHSCALFCTFLHSRKTQLFSFQAFPHSLAKTPGVGVGGAFVLLENFSKNATAPSIRREKRNGTDTKPVPQIFRWACATPRAGLE